MENGNYRKKRRKGFRNFCDPVIATVTEVDWVDYQYWFPLIGVAQVAHFLWAVFRFIIPLILGTR
ncbi:hypothetical protein BS47DRAFT_1346599 [Hydnum rufescens UP504]|uniref:Uncharacterized protein n=1 Tax=Hydnum rufescens UP504 TaxID=1448309 RepID=A0A9P6ATD5_9AGAM|nr:hypothetical protein BS47DRAFT_1346599 [Hydnum rufescens UP504]